MKSLSTVPIGTLLVVSVVLLKNLSVNGVRKLAAKQLMVVI